MNYLLDTNIISELQKRKPVTSVARWYASVPAHGLFISVLVVGEIRQGAERLRRKDPSQAALYDAWLGELTAEFADRLLPVTTEVASAWGILNAHRTLPAVDGLMAATALIHDLTFVTRNVSDVADTGARLLNPFDRQA